MNGRTNVTDTKANDLQIPLDPCTNFVATAGNAQVSLSWTDPLDKYATPEGATAQDPQQLVSVWSYTKIVRKEGSEPVSPNDGITVVESASRNQYESTEYVDRTVTNDVIYYYALFAYNEDGVYSESTVSDPVVPIIGTPLSQLAEGTIIKINQMGSPTEFILAKHNYQSDLNGPGRELIVKKDAFRSVKWSADTSNAWETSVARSEANGYKAWLSSSVQEYIGTTSYYYYNGSYSERAIISDGCFLLSFAELAPGAASYDRYDGQYLSTANIILANSSIWTRSSVATDWHSAWIVNDNNSAGTQDVQRTADIKPCFTLPSTCTVFDDLTLNES